MPKVISIKADDLHVWRLSLNLTAGANDDLWSLLSADEQDRAERFLRVQDQEKFVQVRGSLRKLLGQYVGKAGADLQFDYGDYGKPHLKKSCNPLDLKFNVSHSHELALIAVTQAIAVGIDVEQVNTKVDFQGISHRFFAAEEHQVLLQQPFERQCSVFFQLWTRKEACIKAMGGSIAQALDQVDVSQGLEQPRIIVNLMEKENMQELYVHNLPIGENYAGSVATTRAFSNLYTLQW